MDLIRIIYLPTYFLLQVSIFISDLWLFSNKDNNPILIVSFLITFNLLKECLSGTLGIYVLIFAFKLKNIIQELVYQWGNNLPAIARIKTIQYYIFVMGVTYLAVDLIFNLIYPACEVAHAISEHRKGRAPETKDFDNTLMQFMEDFEVQLILVFNL